MKNEHIIFLNSLCDVIRGRYLWKKILHKYSIDMNMDFIIFLPQGDPQINYYVLLYLNKFIENLERRKTFLSSVGIPIIRRNEKFLILTNDIAAAQCAKVICRRVSQCVSFNITDLNKILSYYRLFPFTDRLIIGMLEGLPGRNGYNALIANGFTVEELVANGIYDFKISKFNRLTRPRVPDCRGISPDVRAFITSNDMRLQSEGN